METGGPTHLLHKGEASRRASFLELFFDLVYVFALTRISARAVEDLTTDPGVKHLGVLVAGAGKTVFLLLALWAVWQGTAWTTSRYDPYRGVIQLVVLTSLVASMVMGVAIPRAFTGRALPFAVAYVVAQLTRSGLLAIAVRGSERQGLKLRMLVTFSVSGVGWIAGALVASGWGRGLLWGLALGLEYLAARTGWPVPGLGRSSASKWDIAGEHLAERYQQFFLIAAGEAVLGIGLTYSATGFGTGQTLAFALSLLTSVLLWRIYFYRAGQILAEAVGRSAQPARIGRSAADSHMIMVAGVVTSAIGYELVIEHPYGRGPWAWTVVILGGPALFMLGRSRFEYEVFGRVSTSRVVVVVTLAVSLPAMVFAPPVAALGLAAVVLGAAAFADARRAFGAPPEPPSPPL